jgi:tripartite-type tricarboxylate transporter receptor subunit TctC
LRVFLSGTAAAQRGLNDMRASMSLGAILAAALLLPAQARAQSPAEFYRSKSVELDIGSSVGGGYDAYGRMIARHLGKYIPGNPTVVPKNIEGAGGLRLTNLLYNAAPRDGSTIGTINRGTVLDPLLGNPGAQFDPTKFGWIGSANNEISVCVAWHTTGIARFEQLTSSELIVGATGPSADTYQFPKIANGVLGTRFKIVTGYPGGNDVDLALERGEVQGRCGWSWTSVKATHQPWLDEKKINLLFQIGLSKHPDLPQVALLLDFAKTDEERQILKLISARQVMAWPYLAPPGVPADRLESLRSAFMQTLRDEEFRAEAAKAGLEISPVSGAEIENLVHELYRTPPAIARKAADLLR